MKTFCGMEPCEEKHKVDVLQWWKKHGRSIPLLSQIARDTLCIPMASASSERVFSASGSIVTDKRHNLATESVKKLLLVKVNYDRVKNSLKMKYVSAEEQVVDPPPPPAAKTPRKKTPIKQSASKQTKIQFARKVTPQASTSAARKRLSSTSSSTSPQPSTSAAKRQLPSDTDTISLSSDSPATTTATPPSKKRKALPPMKIRKRQKMDKESIADMFNSDDDVADAEYVPSEEY